MNLIKIRLGHAPWVSACSTFLAPPLPRDRGFESISLQRGVRNELLIDAAPICGVGFTDMIRVFPSTANRCARPLASSWL